MIFQNEKQRTILLIILKNHLIKEIMLMSSSNFDTGFPSRILVKPGADTREGGGGRTFAPLRFQDIFLISHKNSLSLNLDVLFQNKSSTPPHLNLNPLKSKSFARLKRL